MTDDADAVDISRRYDIYVAETPSRLVVYRGAFFRGRKCLEKIRTYDFAAEFYEIELATGEIVFVQHHGIIKFCDAGTTASAELLPPSG